MSRRTSPSEVWDAVDRVIDRAPRLSDIQSHRIGLLAVRYWRARGQPVPPELIDEELRARLSVLLAPVVLERVVAACARPVIVIKGPAVAACYPEATMRGFSDIDLIVEDAEGAQEALIAAGAAPVGEPALYVDIHHLRPVMWPDLPLPVELHSRPKWVKPLEPPPVEELFARAHADIPELSTGLAPTPAAHALLLAAHSWAHEPLRRIGDLVDIAAVTDGVDRDEVAQLARAWGIERLWSTTISAVDAVLADGPTPLALKVWAQNLAKVRERTVLENHLQRWLSGFWALPPTTAALRLGPTLLRELRREPTEGWRGKLYRSMRALRNARVRTSEHDDELEAARGRPSKR